jgi:hypothetical protein
LAQLVASALHREVQEGVLDIFAEHGGRRFTIPIVVSCGSITHNVV